MAEYWVDKLSKQIPSGLLDNAVCRIQAGHLRALFKEPDRLRKEMEALRLTQLDSTMDGVTRLDLEANWTVEQLKPHIEKLERERERYWQQYLAGNKQWQEQKEYILKLEAQLREARGDDGNGK